MTDQQSITSCADCGQKTVFDGKCSCRPTTEPKHTPNTCVYEVRYTNGSFQRVRHESPRQAQIVARTCDPKVPPRITDSVWLLCDYAAPLMDPELAELAAKAEGDTP